MYITDNSYSTKDSQTLNNAICEIMDEDAYEKEFKPQLEALLEADDE